MPSFSAMSFETSMSIPAYAPSLPTNSYGGKSALVARIRVFFSSFFDPQPASMATPARSTNDITIAIIFFILLSSSNF